VLVVGIPWTYFLIRASCMLNKFMPSGFRVQSFRHIFSAAEQSSVSLSGSWYSARNTGHGMFDPQLFAADEAPGPRGPNSRDEGDHQCCWWEKGEQCCRWEKGDHVKRIVSHPETSGQYFVVTYLSPKPTRTLGTQSTIRSSDDGRLCFLRLTDPVQMTKGPSCMAGFLFWKFRLCASWRHCTFICS